MSDALAWVVIGGGVSLLIGGYCMRWRTVEAQKFERSANKFYERIKPFLEDDEVPAVAVDLLYFLNKHIDDGRAGRDFFLHLLRRRRVRSSETSLAVSKELDAFFERRKELAVPFAEACANAVVAMTYRAGLFGFMLRRLVRIYKPIG